MIIDASSENFLKALSETELFIQDFLNALLCPEWSPESGSADHDGSVPGLERRVLKVRLSFVNEVVNLAVGSRCS